jgi:hypothetical protein
MRRPSTDWRQQLIDDLGAPADGPVLISTGIQLDGPSNEIIRRAARRRGMSPAAFIRRAAVAFACYDLDAGFTAFGRNMGKSPYRPNGHGFGHWRITGLGPQYVDD